MNPNDHQGVRGPLAGLLLETGDHAALEALLDMYDSKHEVTLLYARALLLYRKGGDSAGEAPMSAAAGTAMSPRSGGCRAIRRPIDRREEEVRVRA